ncbi:hypothetical protein [Haladaptatus salinisoli]|uniref:hypothetical protein n=1 Tax=Haladaptatus salinisoli TaxID=2884876 RepID=UPI001D09D3FE|nr:hypothetical protein [Haladaptatus salinisoli]
MAVTYSDTQFIVRPAAENLPRPRAEASFEGSAFDGATGLEAPGRTLATAGVRFGTFRNRRGSAADRSTRVANKPDE